MKDTHSMFKRKKPNAREFRNYSTRQIRMNHVKISDLSDIPECPKALLSAVKKLSLKNDTSKIDYLSLENALKEYGGSIHNATSLKGIFQQGNDDRTSVQISQLCSTAHEHDSALILAAAAVLETPNEFPTWQQLGLCAAASGIWSLADIAFSQAIEIGPDEHYLLWHAGVSALINGNAETATSHFLLARNLQPASPRSGPFLVLAHAASGDYDNAERLLTDIDNDLEIPDWVEKRLHIALDRNLKGILEDAPSSFLGKLFKFLRQHKAHAILGGFSPSNLQLSGLIGLQLQMNDHLQDENIPAALTVLEEIQSNFAGQLGALPVSVGGYLRCGKVDAALKAVMDHGAMNAETHQALADELRQHPAEKCGDIYVSVLRNFPNAQENALRDFALGAHASGAHETALPALLKLKKANSDDIEVTFACAVSAYMMGNSNKAFTELNDVLKLQPFHEHALWLRAEISFSRGSFLEAARDLERAELQNTISIKRLVQLTVIYRASCDHLRSAYWAHRAVKAAPQNSIKKLQAASLFFTEAALSGDLCLIEDAVQIAKNPTKAFGSVKQSKLLCLVFLANIGRLDDALDVLQMPDSKIQPVELQQFWTLLLASNVPKSASDLLSRSDLLSKIDTTSFSQQPLGADRLFLSGLLAQKTEQQQIVDDSFDLILDNPTYLGSVQFQKGLNALLRADSKQALKYLEAAALVEPWSEDIQNHLRLARSLEGLKPKAKARTASANAYQPPAFSKLTTPIITIAVSAYNEARFLADALNSIWLQSFPYWECIIVDDYSSDETIRIAKAYAKLDPRFRVVRHKKNKGLSAARNTALQQTNAPYITFLDGDDYLSQNSILTRYVTMVKRTNGISDTSDIAGAYCSVHMGFEHTFSNFFGIEKFQASTTKSIVSSRGKTPFNSCAPLLKTDVMNEVGGFKEAMRNGGEDWDCWSRIMCKGYSFAPTNYVGAIYREKRDSMIRSNIDAHFVVAKSIYKDLITTNSRSNTLDYPLWMYEPLTDLTKRGLEFAAMAAMSGDDAGFKKIVQEIPANSDIYRIGEIDIEKHVKFGIERFLGSQNNRFIGIGRQRYVDERARQISQQILDLMTQISSNQLDEWMYQAKSPPKTKPKPTNMDMVVNRRPAYMSLEETASGSASEEKLLTMHNRHRGERCFIIGNGPSLNDLDLTKLDGETTIATNGIFYKTDENGFTPTYYLVEDNAVMTENLDKITALTAEEKFFPSVYRNLIFESENVNFFTMNRGFYEPKSPNYRVPRFSTDFSQHAYCGQSVTYLNLQLAYYLGFSEVILIGMDFSYEIPENSKISGDIITSMGEDPNHFHKDYFGKGKTWKKPKLDRVLNNYALAKISFESVGRKIINATAGGQLELFERVAFSSLFEQE